MLQRMSMHGKLAVVTGGTKGIGRAVVSGLLDLGAHVVTCSRTAGDLDELLNVLPQEDRRRLYFHTCDVSIPEARDEFVGNTLDIAASEGVDMSILVNNVGTNIRKPTTAYTAAEASHLVNTNFTSALSLSQALQPALTASSERRGCSSAIVNISSVSGGPSCTQTGSIYAATKGAMNQFTKYTACEWAPLGIRVNAVAPWYIRTPLAEAVLKTDEYARAVLHRTPMGRVGEPSEVADATVYLASDAASYVTGVVMHVDGGFASSGFGFFPGFKIPKPN
eukprot:m.293355 g.293355  ORF g.293355 m.293355 type:complete len:279 (-) comp20016_c0_seq19:2419-3255(-)